MGRVLPSVVLGFLVAALIWLAAAGVASQPGYAWDDSYITYQYGRNLSQGHGLRFNAADARPSEGYSSLLHVLVVALGARFDLDPLLLTRVVSVACLAALPLVLGVPLARLAGTGWVFAAAAAAALQLFWLTLKATRYHLHLGMETCLFTLGLSLQLAWSLLALDTAPQSRRPSGTALVTLGLVAAALVVLGRPEGVVLVCASHLGVHAIRARVLKNLDAPARRALLVQAGLVTAGIAGYLLVKTVYFGYLLPNPYYVKSGKGVWGYAGPVLPGWGQLKEFLAVVSLPALAGALLLWRTRAPAGAKAALALSLAPGAVAALLYARVLPEASFHYRFLYPYLVYVHALVAGAACLALRGSARLQRAAPAIAGGVAIAAVLLVSPALRQAASRPGGWLEQRLENLPAPWWLGRLIGRDLAACGLGQRATVATSMAGAIPWFSGMRLIDMAGLVTDRLCGREPLTPETYWRVLEEARPDVLVSPAPPATPGFDVGSADPALDAAAVVPLVRGAGSEMTAHGDRRRLREMVQREMLMIRDHYAFGTAYRMESGGWTFLYVRRDSPLRDQLLRPFGSLGYLERLGDLARIYGNDPRSLKTD